MRAHVADGADAPIHPASPVKGMVDRVILEIRRGSAKKKIPAQGLRNGIVACHGRGQPQIHPLAVPAKLVRGLLERFGTGNALRPKSKRAVGPNVYLAHLADCAGQNIFDGGTRVVHGMALVAHLCCDFAFFRCARHLAGFVDRPGQRLLHINVFVQVHGGEGDRRMHVISGGHEHGIDVFLAV